MKTKIDFKMLWNDSHLQNFVTSYQNQKSVENMKRSWGYLLNNSFKHRRGPDTRKQAKYFGKIWVH